MLFFVFLLSVHSLISSPQKTRNISFRPFQRLSGSKTMADSLLEISTCNDIVTIQAIYIASNSYWLEVFFFFFVRVALYNSIFIHVRECACYIYCNLVNSSLNCVRQWCRSPFRYCSWSSLHVYQCLGSNLPKYDVILAPGSDTRCDEVVFCWYCHPATDYMWHHS